jgi:hypothetical protein
MTTKTYPLRGIRLYVAVMAAIKAEPMTAAQCAAHLGTALTPTRTVLWYLTRGDLAQVTDWTRDKPGATVYTPTFYGRPGQSATYPGRLTGRAPGSTVTKHAPREKLAEFIEIAHILRDHPMTVFDLHDMLDKRRSSRLHKAIKAMHDAGLIYVWEWTRDSTQGPWAAVWAWGTGRDTRKPRRQTHNEITRRNNRRQHQKRRAQRIAFALAGITPPSARPCQA